MRDIDILHFNDMHREILSGDKLVQQVGFPNTDCIERFLTAWGNCLSVMPRERRPRGLVFFLAPPNNENISFPLDELQKSLPATIDALAHSQMNSQMHTISLAGELGEAQTISVDVRKQIRGGQWTPNQASQRSTGITNRCVCWASGLFFKVFSQGTSAISYVDITDKSLEAVGETYQRQGWGDGELLEFFGSDRLNDRSRRGIWHFPKAADYVLRNCPEQLIQDMLLGYLRENLLGFERLAREYHLESEGRVDVIVVLADGRNYIVEIKWIGRSIKTTHQHFTYDKLKKQLKKWACECVTVMDEVNAKNGVSQLAYYLKNPIINKGYLAVYDCRKPEEVKNRECDVGYPSPANLSEHQYKICHVAVDPRSASVKSADGKNVVC